MILNKPAVAIVIFTCFLTEAIAMERPGGESPEAVVARMGAAMEAHDYREIMACLTTEAEIELSRVIAINVPAGVGLILALGNMALEKNPEAADLDRDEIAAIGKKLEALVGMYLKPPGPYMVEHFAKIDRVSLAEEFMFLLKEVLEKADSAEDFETALPDMIMRSTELTAVEIDGATAAGRVGEDRIAFRKIDERWFIDLLPSTGSWRHSDPYKLAVQAVEASEDVAERFGSEYRFLVPNRAEHSDGVAELNIPLEGDAASGTAYVQAEKELGEWRILKLIVEFSDTKERVFLYPTAEQVSQLAVTARNSGDYSAVLPMLTELAEEGQAQAQSLLGSLYLIGEESVGMDEEKARYWLSLAADQGYAEAQFNLGQIYYNGWGLDQDLGEAMKWYTRAAEQGDTDAQNRLGAMYQNGQGATQDHEKAVTWYRRAAEQGHAPAQNNLGLMYQDGEGVTQDDEEAVTWYRRAAEQDYAWAQYNLGMSYGKGQGVTQDYEEAVEWYRRAAEQGHAHAQYTLGAMYENGYGVSKDLQQAKRWYEEAAAQGYEPAQQELSRFY